MKDWILTAVPGSCELVNATTSPADSLKGFKHSGFMRKRRVALYSPSSGVCSATANTLDDMDAIVSKESVIVVGRTEGDLGAKICDAADLTSTKTLYHEFCYDLVKSKGCGHQNDFISCALAA